MINEIIVLSLISVWFAIVSTIPQTIMRILFLTKWYYNKEFNIEARCKPFDCSKCLGFWLGLVCGLYNYGFEKGLIIAILTSLLSVIIEKVYIKL